MWADSIKTGGCSFTVCTDSDYLAGKVLNIRLLSRMSSNLQCNTCEADCNKMGYEATKPDSNTVYYGITNKKAPYCWNLKFEILISKVLICSSTYYFWTWPSVYFNLPYHNSIKSTSLWFHFWQRNFSMKCNLSWIWIEQFSNNWCKKY